MIQGISHVTLIVQDLEVTTRLLQGVFGARLLYDSGDRRFSVSRERFFEIGDTWLCIMEGDGPAGRGYDHIAFKVPEEELEAYREKIAGFPVEVLPGRPRVAGEGHSVYFYDYDNHLFELHTGTLDARLERYCAR